MEYHGLKPIPDIPGRSEKIFQKHLLEAHRMKYVEKRKGEKNFKADSGSLSIGPGLTKTMVVFVLKEFPKQAYKSSLNVPMATKPKLASTSVGRGSRTRCIWFRSPWSNSLEER